MNKLATKVSKQGNGIPLSILLQDILRVPDRTVRGRAITKGIASVALSRLPEVCPDRDGQRRFMQQVLTLGDGLLDRGLTDATFLNTELAALFDRIIVNETGLGLGDRVHDSEFVEARRDTWKSQNFELYECFLKKVLLGEQRRRGDRSFPLTRELLVSWFGVFSDELKTARNLLLTRFPLPRHMLAHSELEERFCTVVTGGACPHLAATCDKWCAFFAVKSYRRLLMSLSSKQKVALRGIVLQYLAHFTGYSSSYIERQLRAR